MRKGVVSSHTGYLEESLSYDLEYLVKIEHSMNEKHKMGEQEGDEKKEEGKDWRRNQLI